MSRIVVVDASAIVQLLLGGSGARAVRRELDNSRVCAPAHMDAEVASALARLHRNGDLDADAVRVRLRALSRAPVERIPVAPLLEGAWTKRDNVSLRDALYVQLARSLRSPLLTADAKLARASGLGVTLILTA